MVANSGRLMRIRQLSGGSAVAVAGARTDTLTITAEGVDVTDKDSAGWRTLLGDAGSRTLSADVEAVMTNAVFATAGLQSGSGLLAEYSIEVQNIGLFVGDWFLTNVALTGQMADAVTFTATIESGQQMDALINTVAPVVSGTLGEGDTLSTTNGTWTASPSFTYQWQRDTGAGFANISAATSATYVLAAGDVGADIRCLVTATETYGAIVGVSNTVGPVTS